MSAAETLLPTAQQAGRPVYSPTTVHAVGCVCGFPVLAPNLPERQREMRGRMLSQKRDDEQTKRQARINQLCREPDWHATLIILTSRLLSGDRRVWKHVDLDRGLIHFKRILRDYTFSGGERRMVELAASLYNREHKVNLHHALGGLDGSVERVALRAIAAYLRVQL
jgi:hypothetical protein